MDVSLREEYDCLQNKELKFDLIEEINAFKEKCRNASNDEYLYKADLLLSDVYLEHKSFEEPLKLLLNDFNKIDPSIYTKIYVEIVNRILYIYITKQNYHLALKYASIKEKYLDKSSLAELNRFLLEKSYIYAEMNETDKAIECLDKIIKNPTPEALPYALSNITKLFIDKKNVFMAEESLNKCLALNNDDSEGKIYSDYLLAKICVLKENYNDALYLLKQIFENEEINQLTLPMVNDYLELLYSLKKYDEMALAISKLALFVNACDDLYIQKQFLRNKIRYFIATRDYSRLQEAFNDYEYVDKKIVNNEKKVALEISLLEKNDHATEAVNNIIDDLDNLVSVFNNNGAYPSLRDLIMSFCKSIESVIGFDEATFMLINKPINLDFIPQNDIEIYHYKNNRVYEKLLTESCLRNSVSLMVINQNRPVGLDLTEKNIDFIDVFYNRSYIEEKINYIYAVPCFYQGDIFAVMTFASRENNLTEKNVSVLIDFASKVLESSVTTLNILELFNITNDMYNRTVLTNNIGLVKYTDDEMYISNSLMNLLRLKSNNINRRTFLSFISKNDYERYARTSANDFYNIRYRLNIDSIVLQVEENVETFVNASGKKLFKFGTINVTEGSIKSLIDGKALLNAKLDEVRNHANSDVEYRFSFVRIRTIQSDYDLIKLTLGVEPYFISDSDCVCILENEVNLREIDEKVSKITDNYTIIRYPRDISKVNNMLEISDIMLNSGEKYYNELLYKSFIQKDTANKIVSTYLSDAKENRKLQVVRYNSFDHNIYIEASLYFENDFNDIKLVDMLNEDNKIRYDISLFRTIIDKNVTVNTLLFVNIKSLKKILDRGLINEKLHNIYFVLTSLPSNYSIIDISELIEEVSSKANIVIGTDILKYISAYLLTNKCIKGVYLSKKQSGEELLKIRDIINNYSLIVFSKNQVSEQYSRNIYATDVVDYIE